jgi:hypothetical protein
MLALGVILLSVAVLKIWIEHSSTPNTRVDATAQP